MTTLILGLAVAVNGFGLLLSLGYVAGELETSWSPAVLGLFFALIYGCILLMITAPTLLVRSVGAKRSGSAVLVLAVASAFSPLGIMIPDISADFDKYSFVVLAAFAGVGVLNWFALRIRVLPLAPELPNSSVQPTPASGRG